ncbi:hypothetical protein [Chitinilyticum aquatile]|uniref:hypothetical protein n=1 Tax=Chitinilyticum aquatile TaxID=362520 RepID=UPI0012DDA946|nr:hypothetical protein [Chitinilyticum aquatile]
MENDIHLLHASPSPKQGRDSRFYCWQNHSAPGKPRSPPAHVTAPIGTGKRIAASVC